jgi:hypothetical protein
VDVDETLVALVRANLHEVFGQTDPDARLATARRLYAEDVRFVDDEETLVGIDALVAKAARLLDSLPPGAGFGEDGPPYAGAGHAAPGWRSDRRRERRSSGASTSSPSSTAGSPSC